MAGKGFVSIPRPVSPGPDQWTYWEPPREKGKDVHIPAIPIRVTPPFQNVVQRPPNARPDDVTIG